MSDEGKSKLDLEQASAWIQGEIDAGRVQAGLEGMLADDNKNFKVPFALLIPHVGGVHTLTNLEPFQLAAAIASVAQDIQGNAMRGLGQLLAKAISEGRVTVLGPFTVEADDEQGTPSDGKVH